MINVLHLYYDLLNLYGENANTRCIIHNLELNNIKVKIHYKSISDKFSLEDYDIVYIGEGSEDNLLCALDDIKRLKKQFKDYIECNKMLILTGNAMDLFGKYIEVNEEKKQALGIFDYHTKFISESTFKNASADRIVGEVHASCKLIDEKIIGFQNRCDLNYGIKSNLFKTDVKYSNDGENTKEGFTYKNVYATHIIGPLLIRNPYFTDYLLKELCKNKKLKYKSLDKDSINAYKKYLENFL